jgi:hypothetical protein
MTKRARSMGRTTHDRKFTRVKGERLVHDTEKSSKDYKMGVMHLRWCNFFRLAKKCRDLRQWLRNSGYKTGKWFSASLRSLVRSFVQVIDDSGKTQSGLQVQDGCVVPPDINGMLRIGLGMVGRLVAPGLIAFGTMLSYRMTKFADGLCQVCYRHSSEYSCCEAYLAVKLVRLCDELSYSESFDEVDLDRVDYAEHALSEYRAECELVDRGKARLASDVMSGMGIIPGWRTVGVAGRLGFALYRANADPTRFKDLVEGLGWTATRNAVTPPSADPWCTNISIRRSGSSPDWRVGGAQAFPEPVRDRT